MIESQGGSKESSPSPTFVSRLSTADNSMIVHQRGFSSFPDVIPRSESPGPSPLMTRTHKNWSLNYEKPNFVAFSSYKKTRTPHEVEINLDKRLDQIKLRDRHVKKTVLFREKMIKD